MKPLFSYYGGKQKMARHILPLFPEHTCYTEAFAGGAAIFWEKEPSKIEVLNDTNGNIVNFYQVLQHPEKAKELKQLVQVTLHSRSLHREAMVVYNAPALYSDVKRAWALWVACTQSYLSSPGKSWGFAKRKRPHSIIAKKERFGEAYTDRLAHVSVEEDDALKVIKRWDSEQAFHYVDPPYFNSNCGHYDGYSKEDFEALLLLLSQAKGKFILSSYPSDLLKDFAQKEGWQIREIVKTKDASRGRAKKIECLTANFVLPSAA